MVVEPKSCICSQQHLASICMHQLGYHMLLSHKAFKQFHIDSAFLQHPSLKRGDAAQELFPLPCPSLFVLLFYQCDGCLLSLFQVGAHAGLPRFASNWSSVSIQELAANSENSWMSQAPNLHFTRQLLIWITQLSDQKIKPR